MTEKNSLRQDVEALCAERDALENRQKHLKLNVMISLKVLEMQNR